MIFRWIILLLAASSYVFAENYNSSVVKDGEPLTLAELKVIKDSNNVTSFVESPVDKKLVAEAIDRALFVQKKMESDENDDEDDDQEDEDSLEFIVEDKNDNSTEIIAPVTKTTPIFLKFQRPVPEVKLELVEPAQSRTTPEFDGYVLPTEATDEELVNEYFKKLQIRENSILTALQQNETNPNSEENDDTNSAYGHKLDSAEEWMEYLNENPIVLTIVLLSIIALILLLIFSIIRWCRIQERRKITKARLEEINAEMYETSSFSHRFEKITLPENQEVTMQLMSAESSRLA